MNKDLELSPKFAHFLSQNGLLTPIVSALKQYRSKQNYPFELKDKRIFRASILKALCQRQELKIKDVEMYADKWTDEMYELYSDDDNVDPNVTAIMEKNKIPKEYTKEISHMFQTINTDSFNVWIKKFVKRAEKKEIVETLDPKKLKEITDKEETKKLDDKLNEIATESRKTKKEKIYKKPKVTSKK